jgi:hypothetical protein
MKRTRKSQRDVISLILGFGLVASCFALGSTAISASLSTQPAWPAADGRAQGLEIVTIRASAFGLSPNEIEVDPGAKILMIRNQVGVPGLNLSFTVARPGRDVILSGDALNGDDLKTIVPFTPSEDIVVTEASHPGDPAWECRITVTQ